MGNGFLHRFSAPQSRGALLPRWALFPCSERRVSSRSFHPSQRRSVPSAPSPRTGPPTARSCWVGGNPSVPSSSPRADRWRHGAVFVPAADGRCGSSDPVPTPPSTRSALQPSGSARGAHRVPQRCGREELKSQLPPDRWDRGYVCGKRGLQARRGLSVLSGKRCCSH